MSIVNTTKSLVYRDQMIGLMVDLIDHKISVCNILMYSYDVLISAYSIVFNKNLKNQ